MRAQIYITIEDDTPEEKMTAAGMPRERLHDLYYNAFQRLLASFVSPGCRADLRVMVDGGKEGADATAHDNLVAAVLAEVEESMRAFEDDDDGYILKKCEFEFFMREIKNEYIKGERNT